MISLSSATSSACRDGLEGEALEIFAQRSAISVLSCGGRSDREAGAVCCRVEDARHLIDEVADAHKLGIGRSVEGEGRLDYCGVVMQAFPVALVHSGSDPTAGFAWIIGLLKSGLRKARSLRGPTPDGNRVTHDSSAREGVTLADRGGGFGADIRDESLCTDVPAENDHVDSAVLSAALDVSLLAMG